MKESIINYWHKLSRIGLREDESVMEFREVILINRLMIFIPLIMAVYIPIEIFINGLKMIYAVSSMVFLFMATLVFHHYRWFKFAKYYLYLISSLFIVFMGVSVGKGINNHVMFMPILLVGVIIFKTNVDRIVIFIITTFFYLLQQYLFNNVSPIADISSEVRASFTIVFFIMGMLIVFVIGYYFMGINKEYESIIVSQKEGLELKNKEITDSITYAKRIQTAILPSDEIISSHLKEYFVLYMPKDVVAGDFYWIEKIGDVVLFAAADCTGHGVPGAMMSVVCNNALNRSVREGNLTDPGKILDKTRDIIIDELSKSGEDVKDGMDISLVALNTKLLELKWAGANNPLWLLRDSSIVEFKADKQPIGKHINSTPFTTHVTQLHKGDLIYIASDGFQDQFGGPKGKKFKASQLKEYLLKNANKNLQQQKDSLREAFLKWKGNNEQIDDVCIIGVKI